MLYICLFNRIMEILNEAFKFFFLAFSDRRLADHFGGKLHLGYMQIRDKLAELQVAILFKVNCGHLLDSISILVSVLE